MRLIDADKLMLSLNDNYLANSPTGNETLAVQDYRESMCEGLEIAMATVEGAPTVCGWISVKDRMPKSQTCVLVTVKTRNGKHVVLIACHVNAREVDSEDYRWQDAEINWDYDEENDIYWVPECWYEDNFVEDNTSWIIDEYADGIVTHWMPLPEPPKEESDD